MNEFSQFEGLFLCGKNIIERNRKIGYSICMYSITELGKRKNLLSPAQKERLIAMVQELKELKKFLTQNDLVCSRDEYTAFVWNMFNLFAQQEREVGPLKPESFKYLIDLAQPMNQFDSIPENIQALVNYCKKKYCEACEKLAKLNQKNFYQTTVNNNINSQNTGDNINNNNNINQNNQFQNYNNNFNKNSPEKNLCTTTNQNPQNPHEFQNNSFSFRSDRSNSCINRQKTFSSDGNKINEEIKYPELSERANLNRRNSLNYNHKKNECTFTPPSFCDSELNQKVYTNRPSDGFKGEFSKEYSSYNSEEPKNGYDAIKKANTDVINKLLVGDIENAWRILKETIDENFTIEK